MNRCAHIERKTSETQIELDLNLFGGENRNISTGVGFFDHMLDLMAKHGFMDLKLSCKGDTHIDAHHTIEDIGIAFGKALSIAINDKTGIRRYASCSLPMDETLANVALDISGRAFLHYDVPIASGAFVGDMDAQLAEEFFRAVSANAGLTLHINVPYGKNIHHVLEGIFKGFGRALADAIAIDPRVKGVPSTKGSI